MKTRYHGKDIDSDVIKTDDGYLLYVDNDERSDMIAIIPEASGTWYFVDRTTLAISYVIWEGLGSVPSKAELIKYTKEMQPHQKIRIITDLDVVIRKKLAAIDPELALMI